MVGSEMAMAQRIVILDGESMGYSACV